MTSSRTRNRVGAAAVGLALAGAALASGAAGNSDGGVSIILGVEVQSVGAKDSPAPQSPPTEELRDRLGVAQDLVMLEPERWGGAWYDQASEQVVLGSATDAGIESPIKDVSVVPAERSLAELNGATDRLITADTKYPSPVWEVATDPRTSRLVVTVSEANEEVVTGILAATQLRPDAITVIVKKQELSDLAASRTTDTSPFYGGAQISTPVGTCTSGFSWRSSTAFYSVTAGHCAPSGGSISTPVTYMGSVTSGSRENWSTATGTQLFPNQTTYAGDIALVAVSSTKSTTNAIYVGGTTSSDWKYVNEVWGRGPVAGDQYCTGGIAGGELCGWTVDDVNINHQYSSGTWLRNGAKGVKQGWCVRSGDSGGPVYTVTSGWTVSAKGITSGSNFGGDDNYGGFWDPCEHWFSDVRIAQSQLVGWVSID